MKKNLLIIAMALLSLTTAQAQLSREVKTDQQLPLIEANPMNLNPVNSLTALNNYAREQAAKALPMRRFGAKAPMRKTTEAVEYLVAAQSFTKDYTFIYEGGDFNLWNINVTVDGTDVTFEHLFHIEALSPEWNPYIDEVVTGAYDAEAKTVTVAAPTGANGTVVATGNGSFITVVSGEVSEAGQMSPVGNIIFDVLTDADGNITRMTSRYPIALPTYYGSSTYGNNAIYRQFIINLPGDDADLIATTTSLDMGQVFLGEEIPSEMQLLNMGGATASFVIDVESSPEGFIVCETPTGEIAPGEIADIVFTLKGNDLCDDVEGIAAISYESDNAENSFDVVLSGQVISAPDYSAIVKSGDFTFKTNIESPWEITTDEDGIQWAKSGAKGRKMTSDWYVNFTVPTGMIGTLSWTGKYKNNPAFRYSFYNLAGWFVDTNSSADVILQYEGEANGEYEFGPGEHFIRFQQQAQYASGYEDDGLYIRDLNLNLVQPAADAAEVKTSNMNFGYFVLENGQDALGDKVLSIQNRGVNTLTLISATSDNPEFEISTDAEPAKTLDNLDITVFFNSKEAGTKTATLTIETSAGTFTVPAKAVVVDQPDFSQIVTEGAEYLTITTNPNHPFIVEDGKAYNIDCDDEDLVASDRYSDGTDLTLSFDIPEGKMGYITWDGHVWGTPEESYNSDYAVIMFNSQPLEGYGNMGEMNAFATDEEQGGDASSRLFSNDEYWADFLTKEPGHHTFTFRYLRNGDGVTHGKNRLEISNIRLHVEDFKDNDAILLTEGPVEFTPTYVGYNRFTTVNATLKNTGSQPLRVTGFKAEKENSPFVSILPANEVAYNSTVNVTLVFYPGVHLDENGNVTYVDETVGKEDTWFTDNVTIKTTAGDFTLAVKGMAKGSEGIVFIGDFEDDAYGWERIDHDGDGYNWDLGTSLWWYEEPSYCHSGVQCIGSASSSSSNPDMTPDNWVYSPAFTVPEEGAVLSWFAASQHNVLCEEHYSVYIEEDFSDESKFDDMTPVFSETLEVDPTYAWHEHHVDLKDYAGKTVRMAFRHHDCTGQYLLKIDDAFVYTYEKYGNSTVGISSTDGQDKVAGNQYFNVAGQRSNSPAKGLNIVRQTMKDGSVKNVKFINK